MSELKPCPFCGGEARLVNCGSPMVVCLHGCCQIVDDKNSVEHWNTRPIEDELRAELASKDEQIEKLEDALHKISNWCKAYPLEIADEPTIYENGEKHNANWCKRKAQEGLGIK